MSKPKSFIIVRPFKDMPSLTIHELQVGKPKRRVAAIVYLGNGHVMMKDLDGNLYSNWVQRNRIASRPGPRSMCYMEGAARLGYFRRRDVSKLKRHIEAEEKREIRSSAAQRVLELLSEVGVGIPGPFSELLEKIANTRRRGTQ